MTAQQEYWLPNGDGTETLKLNGMTISRCIGCNGFLLTTSVPEADLGEVLDMIRPLAEMALQKGPINLTVEVGHHQPRKPKSRNSKRRKRGRR